MIALILISFTPYRNYTKYRRQPIDDSVTTIALLLKVGLTGGLTTKQQQPKAKDPAIFEKNPDVLDTIDRS